MKYLLLTDLPNNADFCPVGSIVTLEDMEGAAVRVWGTVRPPAGTELIAKLVGIGDGTLYRFRSIYRKGKPYMAIVPVLDVHQTGTLTSMQDLVFRMLATLPVSELMRYVDHTLFKIPGSEAMVLLKARLGAVL